MCEKESYVLEAEIKISRYDRLNNLIWRSCLGSMSDALLLGIVQYIRNSKKFMNEEGHE